MILRVYGIRDLKAGAFAPPFFMQRDEMAVRAFSDAIQDPQHAMSRHPEDYHLFYLGEYNDESGSLVSAANGPVFLVTGLGEMAQEK